MPDDHALEISKGLPGRGDTEGSSTAHEIQYFRAKGSWQSHGSGSALKVEITKDETDC